MWDLILCKESLEKRSRKIENCDTLPPPRSEALEAGEGWEDGTPPRPTQAFFGSRLAISFLKVCLSLC